MDSPVFWCPLSKILSPFLTNRNVGSTLNISPEHGIRSRDESITESRMSCEMGSGMK